MSLSPVKLCQKVLNLDRSYKRWLFRGFDTVVITLSYYLAFCLRFELTLAPKISNNFLFFLGLAVPIKIIIFTLVGVYRPVLRYAGVGFLKVAFIGVVVSAATLALLAYGVLEQNLPRSILILDGIVNLSLMIGMRVFLLRALNVLLFPKKNQNRHSEHILIYGAGSAGSHLANSLARTPNLKVVGFLDDDEKLQHHQVAEYEVFSTKSLDDIIQRNQVTSVLLAMPSASRSRISEILKRLEPYTLKITTIPSASEIVSGKVSINQIHEIDIVDLLGRQEVEPDQNLLKGNIEGKVVLVTGAGGSIGSELCRQIILQGPRLMLVLDQNELALYQIMKDLSAGIDKGIVKPVLGSILNRELIERLLKEHQVNTIYHAAAFKHVPIVEENHAEGLRNNIGGTLTLVKAAFAAQIQAFVLISTDKAVRPTNIMGASKRTSELVLQAFQEKEGNKTLFAMVRFGNVLDSSGSVVPLFREQIRAGKDITLTHKDITRYFMSIPEAARLVIQAGAMAKGGDVFVLDMGKPVKIYDLAEQMIRLSGLQIGMDIDIKLVGLRPGEKLYEELLIDPASSQSTDHAKIFKTNEHMLPWEELEPLIQNLFDCSQGSRETAIEALKQVVREYTGPVN